MYFNDSAGGEKIGGENVLWLKDKITSAGPPQVLSHSALVKKLLEFPAQPPYWNLKMVGFVLLGWNKLDIIYIYVARV